jgi:hypothetical protein
MKVKLTQSRWLAEELDKKTVEFRMPVVNEGMVEGLGKLWAIPCPNDLLSISVVVRQRHLDGSTSQIRVWLPQSGVDCIEFHPDQKIAQFRLFV